MVDISSDILLVGHEHTESKRWESLADFEMTLHVQIFCIALLHYSIYIATLVAILPSRNGLQAELARCK